MENTEKYKLLAEGNFREPSVMGVVPANESVSFKASDIESFLRSSEEFTVKSFDKIPNTDEIEGSFYAGAIEYKNEVYSIQIRIGNVKSLELNDFGLGNMVKKQDIDKALLQPYFAEVFVDFREDSLESFHLQLKILNALVPQASLVVDFMSFRLLSGKWLSMTALSKIPPSPDYLYVLHAVYDEKDGRTEYWLHTHGLLRCGIAELEVLNITSGSNEMYNLINNVVKRFLSDPVKENVKFAVGFDGLNINLQWLRWEEALGDFPPTILGSIHDRQGDENDHSCPSGVLFAVEDNNLVSPEIYVSTLANNPVLYVSSKETQRMSELAKERYPYFLELYEKDKSKNRKGFLSKLFKKTDENRLIFVVKLGLVVDNAQDTSEREHLWFGLISADSKTITGKLMNQPYWISGLNEGDENTYPIENLTDWMIYDTEGNQYSPDSVYQLI